VSQWSREHPELVGTDADPWMRDPYYRDAVEEFCSECGAYGRPLMNRHCSTCRAYLRRSEEDTES
jgi:hypothetical protein